MEVDCPSWNRLVHFDIDYTICQDWSRNSAIDERYLVLVMFQRVVPLNKTEEGEWLGGGVL